MSLYDEMKAKGVDMSWYEKLKGKGKLAPPPLFDEYCGRLSIYVLKADGTLWTADKGEPYLQVRSTGKKRPKDTLICLHCKKQFSSVETAYEHGS